MRVLIVGCGYVGLALGAELVRRGHEVHGARRDPMPDDDLRAAGIVPRVCDVTRPETFGELSGPYDWVVNTVSSVRGGADVYREVYLQGTRNLIDWLTPSRPRRYVYTSSTSVYAQTDGSVVDESSPTEPASETSRILLDTERLLTQAAAEQRLSAVILRAAGIYGPERGYLFLQYLRDEARMAGGGERFINMIHRDDLARAIIAALERGGAGEIYNAVDTEPVSQAEFFGWLSDRLGKPLPPAAAPGEGGKRKRATTNKRVCSAKLVRDLAFQFLYPTYREGYSAEIERLRNLGRIKISV